VVEPEALDGASGTARGGPRTEDGEHHGTYGVLAMSAGHGVVRRKESTSRRGPVRRSRSAVPGHGTTRRHDDDLGAVTAEFAVIMPVIAVVVSLVIGVAAVGTTSVRTEEAARLAARSLARGDSEAEARRIARDIAGRHAVVGILHGDRLIRVTVASPAPGPIGEWGGIVLTGQAETGPEPGAST